uniref:Endoplasmic reticulum junction formation protein lunapark n=1 Tax=Aceria tosichella TaxID=561515 RepID=A0A6G1SAN1_9ACAR
MGLVFSRFYDKPSTRDTLERIEQDIQNIEERRWDKIKREQFIVQILSFIPITILIATVCILIYPTESSIRDKLLLCVPITIVNLFLWLCRRIVQWYSRWSLDNEEVRLRKLQKEKKRILEMVCETESYRVAAELLEKYDPKQLRRRERAHDRPTSPLNTTLTKISASPNRPTPAPAQQPTSASHNQSQQQLNAMSFMNQSISFHAPVLQPTPAPPPPTPNIKPMKSSNGPKPIAPMKSPLNTSIAPVVAASSVQGRPVRPVLSKDRTFFERLVDWVVADGPENRFALICRYCYGHNGMSLAEEYETINFRCCYCYNLNTTTNKRQVYDQLQSDREKSEKEAEKTIKTPAAEDEAGSSDGGGSDKDENDDPGKKGKEAKFDEDSKNNNKDESEQEDEKEDTLNAPIKA